MKKLTGIDWTAIIFLIIGLLILLVLPLMSPYRGHLPIDQAKAADFGEFVGGYIGAFFMLMSVVLLIFSLSLQRRGNQFQQFEIKFLDLLKLHRENVDELKLEAKTQRAVFIILRSEFQDLYDIIKREIPDLSTKKLDIAQIAYIILYYGLGETSTPMVKSILKKYDQESINRVLDVVESYRRKGGYKDLNHLKKFLLDDYYPFNGHQSRLGHYYRHLFQTIKYIDNQTFLTNEEKKFYAKILRAQFSNHEIAIFLYNSLSPMGKIWREPITVDENNNKISYMEKYALIKNIPLNGFTYEIDPTEIVSLDYEWSHITAEPTKQK
jgi:hypothetical protein